MKRSLPLAAAFAVVTLGSGSAFAQGPLQVGDKAPEFPNPLPSTAGSKAGEVKLSLADFIGKRNIVLAFYVADWTGG